MIRSKTTATTRTAVQEGEEGVVAVSPSLGFDDSTSQQVLRRRRSHPNGPREDGSGSDYNSKNGAVVQRARGAQHDDNPSHRPASGNVTTSSTAGATGSSGPATTATATGAGRLLFCTCGVCFFYLVYGILQEHLFTGTKLGPSLCLVTACATNVLVATAWQYIMSNSSSTSSPATTKQSQQEHGHASSSSSPSSSKSSSSDRPLDHAMFVLTSLCYVVSMACSNEAVPLVSYPMVVLAKSCKLVPTLVVGSAVNLVVALFQKTASKTTSTKTQQPASSVAATGYSAKQWAAALLITSGILLFQYTRMQLMATTTTESAKATSAKASSSKLGMILLWASLFFDGLLGSCQDALKQKHHKKKKDKDDEGDNLDQDNNNNNNNNNRNNNPIRCYHYRIPTAMETMLYINLYALVFLIPWATHQQQMDLQLLRDNWGSIAAINVAAAAGQVFIFLTLAWYSPIVTTTITTTRKFLTLLISVWTFGHKFTSIQWFAIVVVFVGLYFAIMEQQQQLHQKKTNITTSSSSTVKERQSSPSKQDESGEVMSTTSITSRSSSSSLSLKDDDNDDNNNNDNDDVGCKQGTKKKKKKMQ